MGFWFKRKDGRWWLGFRKRFKPKATKADNLYDEQVDKDLMRELARMKRRSKGIKDEPK